MLPSLAGNSGQTISSTIEGSKASSARSLGPAAFKVLHDFKGGSDGENPHSSLVDVDGTLYGTTESGGGGAFGLGTVFELDAGGNYRVLYRFKGGREDGAYPTGSLTYANGQLYGTTSGGGDGAGTVFSLGRNGVERVLYSFKAGNDGSRPNAPLLYLRGSLYGTTSQGGKDDNGTVFVIKALRSERIIYRFTGGRDGATPEAGLTYAGGALYGTTEAGGRFCGFAASSYARVDCGTVFAMTLSGKKRVLYEFKGLDDGAQPTASMIDVRGMLYGTTSSAGPYFQTGWGGTVFSITTSGKSTVLHAFNADSEDLYPTAAVVYAGGAFYGTTLWGCDDGSQVVNNGSVFSMSATGQTQILHCFTGGDDGFQPAGALLNAGGKLYGTATGGGTFKEGTIFTLSMSPST
ncbi:MAG TPA: choice-of-anchor tandem repeat GloVer-containing protein [Candidatus Acidoferrales bacterium]|nr:choice-of-anchor tandem repeat GloVer-containing protein [Candidatus Acidoferrales bacterium]